jgi:hypothetical protein
MCHHEANPSGKFYFDVLKEIRNKLNGVSN